MEVVGAVDIVLDFQVAPLATDSCLVDEVGKASVVLAVSQLV